MRVIIPIAGYGKRFEPFTKNNQKCLIPILGNPMLKYNVEFLIKEGFDDISFILGHYAEKVVDFLDNRFPEMKFSFYYQNKILGLGHAIANALEEKRNEPILIILGDLILKKSFMNKIKLNRNYIALFKVDNPERYGVVELHNNTICNFVEKPINFVSNLAMVGIYYIESESKLKNSLDVIISNKIQSNGEFQLTDGLSHMLDNGEQFSYFLYNNFYDCGTINSFFKATRMINKNSSKNFIDKSSIIENSQIVGSTIGKNCVIKNSTLDNVIVLDNTNIENEVRQNIIIDSSVINKKMVI